MGTRTRQRNMTIWSLSFGFALLVMPVGPAAQTATDEVPLSESISARVPAKIPAAARARTNPFKPSEEALERGERLYASQCSMCHGSLGAGDGSLSESLRMKVPDFRQRSARTDGELFYILTEGHGRMPAEGERLSEEWRWDMVTFVRSLSRD